MLWPWVAHMFAMAGSYLKQRLFGHLVNSDNLAYIERS